MEALQRFKEEFSRRKGIHFNSAGQSPVSRRAFERAVETLHLQQCSGSLGDPELLRMLSRARNRLSSFLGAEPSALALVPNVATAISQAAFGFPLARGDQVVTLDQEYASNFYPWKLACERSGAELVVVRSSESHEVSLETLLHAIHDRVRIVAVSWVQFQTGSVLDLNALGHRCEEVGAFLVVDGIQGIGQLPFSFRDSKVHFIAGASHKWMCSALGQGFFVIKPEFSRMLSPLVVGAGTYNRRGCDADVEAMMETTAMRFEPGGLAFSLLFALDSAVELLMEVGVENLEGEISRLSRHLRRGMLQLGVKLATPLDQRGGISSFQLPETWENRFLQECRTRGVALAKRGKYLRLSPHAFCTEDEVETVLGLMEESRE